MIENRHLVTCSELETLTVNWGSKKQSCVALSTAKAEYMSLTMAAKEGIWLNRLLSEMKAEKEQSSPVTLYEDKPVRDLFVQKPSVPWT